MPKYNKKAYKKNVAVRGNTATNVTSEIMDILSVKGKFNSGSSIDFSRHRGSMVEKFQRDNCWDLVAYPDAVMVADANGNFPDIVETAFNRAEPVIDVETEIQNQIVLIQQTHEVTIQQVQEIPGVNAAERRSVLLKAISDRNNAIAHVRNSRAEITRKQQAEWHSWNQDRETFQARKACAHKVFAESLGPAAKAVCQEYLELGRLRAAWVALNRYYHINQGGRTNAKRVTELLQRILYEKPAEGGYKLERHIDCLNQLFKEYHTATGHDMDDELKVQYLEDSFIKSSCHEFDEIFKYADHADEPVTYAQFLGRLQKRVSRILISDQADAFQERANSVMHQRLMEAAPVNDGQRHQALAVVNDGRKNVMVCSVCKKPGHIARKCWSQMTCRNCNQLGHPAFRCPNRNGGGREQAHHVSSPSDGDRNGDGDSRKTCKTVKIAKVFQSKLNKSTSAYMHPMLFYCCISRDHQEEGIVRAVPGAMFVGYGILWRTGSLLIWFKKCFILLHRSCMLIAGFFPCVMILQLPLFVEFILNGLFLVFFGGKLHRRNPLDCHHYCLVADHIELSSDEVVDVIASYDSILETCCYSHHHVDNHTIHIPVIFDSGATSHMLPVSKILSNYQSIHGCVMLGSKADNRLAIKGKGDCHIFHDVLYVPDLRFGLISIGQFDKENCVVTIGKGVLTVVNDLGECIAKGTLRRNLYFLDLEYYEKYFQYPVDSNNNELVNVNVLKDESLDVLHQRWGHISAGKLKSAYRNNSVLGLKRSYNDIKGEELSTCPSCLKGRMRSSNAPDTTNHDWLPLEKIGMDYKGPFPVKSVHGYRGFFLLSDYASDYLYVHLVKSKSEALDAMKLFNSGVVIFHDGTWKILQSDYDNIIVNERVKDWLLKQNIKLQLSAPYVHYQNGQVERDIQHLMNKARTLMASYNVPPKYWEYAIKTACYLINRSPNSEDITPYEVLFKEKPSVAHLVPFYCPGYYHVTIEERKKNKNWTYHAEPCRMLGYDEQCKDGYIVLSMRTRRIYTRKDCVFDVELSLDELNDIVNQPYVEEVDAEDDIEIIDDLEQEGQIDEPGEPPEMVEEDDELEEPQIEDEPISSINPEEEELKDSDDVNIQSHNSNSEEEEEEEDIPHRVLRSGRVVGAVPTSSNIATGNNNDKDEAPDTDDDGDTDSEDLNVVTFDSRLLERMFVMEAELFSWYCDACFILNNVVKLPDQPRSVSDALSGVDSDKWSEAILKELQQLDDRGMFGEASQEGRAMKTKMVLKVSFDNDYNVKFKARLVACGYSQIFGLDYSETFSPTVSIIIVFILLHLAASTGLHLAAFDVSGAFLEGDSDRKLFCWLPKELSETGKPLRVEILKNLYGEKQAPKVWNDKLNEILLSLGFIRCPADPCLYFWTDDMDVIIIAVHVDDGLIVTSNQELLADFLKKFEAHVHSVTLYDPIKKYLGIDFHRVESKKKIFLSQLPYILDKVKKLSDNNTLGVAGRCDVPMNPTINLKLETPNPDNESLLPVTGALRFITDRTRRDLSVSLGEVSSGGADKPSDNHVRVANQMLQYLSNSADKQVCLGGDTPIELFGFCDASYVTTGNCKSRLGGCLFLGLDAGAFHSFSKSDTTVSHSSTEAEIKALDELVRDIMWIRDILEFIQCPMEGPTKIYMDNRSAIVLCETLRSSHKVRHMNVRINFIREMINQRIIELHFVPSELNVADVLTKPLSKEPFLRHSEVLMNGFGNKFFIPSDNKRIIINNYNNNHGSNSDTSTEEYSNVVFVLNYIDNLDE